MKSWALAYVSHVGFVRAPESNDDRCLETADGCTNELDDMSRHAVVHFARSRNQPGELGRGLDDEPWIDRDAVPTDAGPGAQEADARMAPGELDCVPNVNPHSLRDQRELIRERDVHVPVRVFHKLDELGRCGVSLDEFPCRERAVHLGRGLRGCRVETSDDAVVRDELDE